MSCIRQVPPTSLVDDEVASVLRHDLVTPINLIVGYCDLLIYEAVDLGDSSRLASLRSIRSLGYLLLKSIDQSLLSNLPNRSVADIQALGQSLNGPSMTLLQRCDALIVASAPLDASTNDFNDDLQKIRSAVAQMILMADSLVSGQFAGENKATALRSD